MVWNHFLPQPFYMLNITSCYFYWLHLNWLIYKQAKLILFKEWIEMDQQCLFINWRDSAFLGNLVNFSSTSWITSAHLADCIWGYSWHHCDWNYFSCIFWDLSPQEVSILNCLALGQSTITNRIEQCFCLLLPVLFSPLFNKWRAKLTDACSLCKW